MKKMKCTAQFGIGLFILGSMYFISGGLAAMSPEVQVSTFTKMFEGQTALDLPEDWEVKVWHGTSDIEIVREQKGTVLRLRSHQSNVALYKTVQVDLAQYPQLTWEWKVTELPIHGDARDGQRDDQAAGIYVIFPRFPEFLNSRIIGYVWESDAPQGTVLQSQNDSRIHYVVVRSGQQQAGEWIQERRNVEQDYQQIFGENPPLVNGISLMIDSDHTESSSESYFGEIYFSPEQMVKVW